MLIKLIPISKAKQNIIDFVRYHYDDNPKNLKNFIFLDISKRLFFEIKNGNKKADYKLLQLIKKSRKEAGMEKISQIKNLWGGKEKEIIEKIKDITGIKISADKITLFLDPYTNLGFYGKSYISIGTKIKMKDVIFVITHELFHIFYFKKIKKLSLKIDEQKEWKLSEVAVYLLQKEMRKLWPSCKIYLYPEIRSIFNKVKDYWKSGRFNAFLVKSYNAIK